ncbi:MAG: hypothetical protein ABIF85_01580 [Nanoarchaeota archaeon]|nr:AbrB/MazE/SpoVT family DNA-binding domain-containing protein [Nanoarchaeota archaeon]MBU4299730.1 AbrB/MazE/SpoVT family DNA-binding domain-containing protein [Nanoarchaeota archaeon]MBU4452544.1 AbrB/MazE/SpoVT family DNA-binding domain-containing protein [Nanoarchaeota archaeon]MCG2723509.1 AbrB/MazE/SpoVT family DNA-binding domain-containing protein [archaeon]
MAEIKSMDMHDGKIEIKLSISNDEYRILKHHMSNLTIFPCEKDTLTYSLTTGKLGNSNRVMLPKKFLESFNIKELDKKVPSNIFVLNGDAYLLIKIKSSKAGIPTFKEDELK